MVKAGLNQRRKNLGTMCDEAMRWECFERKQLSLRTHSPLSKFKMFNSRSASSAAIKRLTIEYKQLSSDPNTLFPAVGPISEDNYLEWEALVPGPDDTPFEGGVFSARLSFRE